MEQDERPTARVSFVVEVDAVDLGVLAGAFLVCGPGHGHAPCANEKSAAENRDSPGARNSSVRREVAPRSCLLLKPEPTSAVRQGGRRLSTLATGRGRVFHFTLRVGGFTPARRFGALTPLHCRGRTRHRF